MSLTGMQIIRPGSFLAPRRMVPVMDHRLTDSTVRDLPALRVDLLPTALLVVLQAVLAAVCQPLKQTTATTVCKPMQMIQS